MITYVYVDDCCCHYKIGFLRQKYLYGLQVCMFVKDTHETGENREWGEILLKQCLYIHL